MRNPLLLAITLSATVAYAKPAVVISTPSQFGHQDAAQLGAIAAVVEAAKPGYLACYTSALDKTPGLTGSLEVTLSIAVDGTVKQASVKGFDSGARACVEAVLAKLQFARQPNPVTVEYRRWAFAETTKPDETGAVWEGFTAKERQMLIDDQLARLGNDSATSGLAKAPWVSTLSFGAGTVHGGGLDAKVVRHFLVRRRDQMRYCYEKRVLADHKLGSVTVTATFTILPSGIVRQSTATGLASVADCVAGQIRTLEFPKPKDGELVEVAYPLTFARVNK